MTQTILDFDKITMSPLALLYLLAIQDNSFDKRLHKGEFAAVPAFIQRIRDLLNMGLITYDGHHRITLKGVEYITNVLKVKP